MPSTAVVVTGLPAGGKTTVAKHIAAEIGWPLLDKDSFLEELFTIKEVSSFDDRRRLSRLSDDAFRRAAANLNEAVLVSHWRPSIGPQDTGTPPEFITENLDRIVEVHCVCSIETCVARFQSRVRHPGHRDKVKSCADIEEQIRSLEDGYPLGIGLQLSIVTEGQIDYRDLLNELRVAVGI